MISASIHQQCESDSGVMETPLQLATRLKRNSLVKILLQLGAKVDKESGAKEWAKVTTDILVN